MTRLETILVGAYRDLLRWKATESVQISGMGSGRHRLCIHNSRVRDAGNDVVDCDSPHWLGRAPSAGDAACNSRAYRELEQRGLAVRLTGGAYCGRGRTIALHLTEAGKAKAAELLSQITDSATSVDSTPAAATSGTFLEVC